MDLGPELNDPKYGLMLFDYLGIQLNPYEEAIFKKEWNNIYDQNENILGPLVYFYSDLVLCDSPLSMKQYLDINKRRKKHIEARIKETRLDKELNGILMMLVVDEPQA